MKKKVLSAVITLSVVAVVCVTLLAVFNQIWAVSDEEKFNRSVNSIMQADGFEILYNYDDQAGNPAGNYAQIKAFNDDIGSTDNYRVRIIRKAKGGRDDGYYLFQSRGRGFGGGYVEVLIGYTPDGALTGVVKVDISVSNDRAGNINWNTVSAAIKNKTYEDEFNGGEKGGAQVVAGTEATVTLGGASEAIKISNQFFKDYIKGSGPEQPKPEIVTSSVKIAQLNSLFNVENSGYYRDSTQPQLQYVMYPVTTAWEAGFGGQARVNALYYADETYVIAEVQAQRGGYGNWTLLVLLNNETNLVAAINPIAKSYKSEDGYDASELNSAKNLTGLYKGVALSAISGMTGEENLLQGTTKPTQTIDGLKACVYHVLKNAGKLRTDLAAFIAAQQ